MGTTINLTKVDGCYTKELNKHLDEINEMMFSSISVEGMKKEIRNIIAPAFYNKNAKPRFLSKLKRCNSKADVLQLCTNAVIHGMYYNPKTKRTV